MATSRASVWKVTPVTRAKWLRLTPATRTPARTAERVRRMYELYKDRFAILLIGDFNSSPPGAANGSKAMEVLMGAEDIRSAIDLLDYEQNPAPHYTFSSATPDRMIDFVLYNENFITKVDAKVLSEAGEISDHLPVYFEFFIHKEIGFFRQF